MNKAKYTGPKDDDTSENTETNMTELLKELILEGMASVGDFGIHRIVSFEEDGVMTLNQGLVIRMNDGQEFQVEIIRSR